MGGPGLSNATFAVQVVLAAFAWVVTKRSREHAGVAGFVTWMTAADIMRQLTVGLRGQAAHPLHGAARLGFHLDQLLVTSWSFVFLACCAFYFLRVQRIALSILGLWLVAWVVLAATYPTMIGARLLFAYQVLFWSTLAISWSMILFAMFRRRAMRPGLSHLVLIMYAAADLVVGAFPFLHTFVGRWQDVRAITLLALSLCVVFHLNEIFRPQRARDVPA